MPTQATRPLGRMGGRGASQARRGAGLIEGVGQEGLEIWKRDPNLLSYAEWEAQQAIEKQAFCHRANGAIDAPGFVNTSPVVTATQNPDRKSTGTSPQ